MSAFNLPHGVSVMNQNINPDDTWEKVFDSISDDCTKEGWTDCDAYAAWQLGKAALKAARSINATFPHDGPQQEVCYRCGEPDPCGCDPSEYSRKC